MNENNKVIIIIALVIAFFLNPTVNFKFIMNSFMEIRNESMQDKIESSVVVALSSEDELKSIFSGYTSGEQLQNDINIMIEEKEKKSGPIYSYRVEKLKDGEYKFKEKPGLIDGVKNGFISLMKPVLGIISFPFIVVIKLFQGNGGMILSDLKYSIISTFTRPLTLFFMKGGVLYYIGFFLGLIIASSIFKVSAE
jgi:hypothetical protein